MPRRETYADARDRLLEEMPKLSRDYEAVTYNRGNYLKFPYLLYGRDHKLTFSAQAIHDEAGHSLWVDFRGMSAEEFDETVKRHYR